MTELLQRIRYITRLIDECNNLIRIANRFVAHSPAQTERIRRWQRVRRALYHDLDQLLATLPTGTKLPLFVGHNLYEIASQWSDAQLAAFSHAKTNDPLNEGVLSDATLSERVS